MIINKILYFSLFFISSAFLLLSFNIIIFQKAPHIFLIVLFCINLISLHNLFNITHIASHYQISKNRVINDIIGNLASLLTGITFADFKGTHLIHHFSPGNPESDPDYHITHGSSFFILPFKIFIHDVYFWRKGLWKKNRSWISYLISRLIQISIVSWFFINGFGVAFLTYWLIPIYIIGFFNGLFLFYFPHNIHEMEKQITYSKSNPWGIYRYKVFQFFLGTPILISRIYHERHHNDIRETKAYFPITAFVISSFQKKWKVLKSSFTAQYISKA